MDDTSHDQATQDTAPTGDAENRHEYRLFERAVDLFLNRIMRGDGTDADADTNEIENEINIQDIDTSDMPTLEHIPEEHRTLTGDSRHVPQASSSSHMDVDVGEQSSGARDVSNDRGHDDMPALLEISDSDSEADDVEMLVMDDFGSTAEIARDLAHIASLPSIIASDLHPEAPQTSSELVEPPSNPTSEASTSSNPRHARRAYVEDEVEDEVMRPHEAAPAQVEQNGGPVRIGSRRARSVDDDDEDGRRSMRSTNNATPVPPTPTPAPPSRTVSPTVSNTPNSHPDRAIRPLPRNGPPPLRAVPPADAGDDRNIMFRQLLTTLVGAAMNGVQPVAQAPNFNVNNQPETREPGVGTPDQTAQPVPNNAPDAPPSTGDTPGVESGEAQEGQDVTFDMFFHFITPDGNITTHRAGDQPQPQAQAQNPNQNANQPQQGAQQNPNVNPNVNANGMPQGNAGFGGIVEQMLRAAMAHNRPEEHEDPERAKKLVAGLEVVPEGLVKRLERVGGAPGTHEDMVGDPGCAICWDSLLHADEDEKPLDDGKEGEMTKEKSNDESASILSSALPSPEQVASTHAPVIQDTAAASASTPTDQVPSPTHDEASGSASADPKPDIKAERELKIVELPCAHVFHAKCLIPWFSRPNQTTCPVCRFNIDPENLTFRPGSVPSRFSRAPGPWRNIPVRRSPFRPPTTTARRATGQEEQQPDQSLTQASPSGSRPASPRPVQPGPLPRPPEARATYTFGWGDNDDIPAQNPPPFFTVNLDLVVDGTPGGGFSFRAAQDAAPQPQPQPNPDSQPQVVQQQDNETPVANGETEPNPPTQTTTPTQDNNNAQPAQAEGVANNAAPPRRNPGTPLNFFNTGFPMPGLAPGAGFGFMGMGMGPHRGVPRPRRERKEWTLPAAPGLTLRQRVEKKEREAGLRCCDVSCGIGPTDEDPTPDVSSLTDALKQISISRDGASGKEPVCEHLFHPACLVSAGRTAGWGQQEDAGEEVEVSCPVCRKAGHVDRLEWDEGVQESLA